MKIIEFFHAIREENVRKLNSGDVERDIQTKEDSCVAILVGNISAITSPLQFGR